MTTQTIPPHTKHSKPLPSRAAREFEYVIAVGINAALIYVVHNLLEWNWAPFLTEDFTRLLPILTISLGATVAINLAYMAYDRVWFKSITQVGLLVLSGFVTAGIWDVFPFDFSNYDFAWAGTTRAILIVVFVAIVLGIISELVRLAGSWLADDVR